MRYFRASEQYLLTITSVICTGLKSGWIRTMKTTAQFPVNPGTVVEVTCSYSDAVKEGNNDIICKQGADFLFSEEPSCLIPG